MLFPERPVSDLVRDQARCASFVAEARAAVEEEIEVTKGAKGVRLRLVYSTVQRLRPTFIDDNIERMLPSVALRLDRYVVNRPEDQSVSETFAARAPDVAEDLLAIVDESAALTQRENTLRAYRWGRPFAADHLIDLLPVVGVVLEKHLDAA